MFHTNSEPLISLNSMVQRIYELTILNSNFLTLNFTFRLHEINPNTNTHMHTCTETHIIVFYFLTFMYVVLFSFETHSCSSR